MGKTVTYQFDQGDLVKDEVSAFEGVVTGRTDYYNGCVQYLVQGQVEKAHPQPHSIWVDESALILVREQHRPPRIDEDRPGGPSATAPTGLR